MKFVMAYSGGKDCSLALDRMLRAGHTCVALMTFVHTRRKLFYTGTTALLAVATIYHSVYNTLVQSSHQLVGFLLPVITFVPVIVLLNTTTRKE